MINTQNSPALNAPPHPPATPIGQECPPEPMQPTAMSTNTTLAPPQPVRYVSDASSITSASAAATSSGMEVKHAVTRTTKDDSLTLKATSCATTGTIHEAAAQQVTATSALGAENRIMALRHVLELRERNPITLYHADAFETLLQYYNLLHCYPSLPNSLHQGFDTGIRRIYNTYTPDNGHSLYTHSDSYNQIINTKFSCRCYIGPLSRIEVEAAIGPFQSSPLSLIPKPGKPGQFRAIHNFSFPYKYKNNLCSINYTIDADVYPCTWGTFSTICQTIFFLPPGSQAAV